MADVVGVGGTARMKRLRLLVEVDQVAHPGGRRLNLRGPDLDALPPEVFMMLDLEVLDLSPERQSCLYYHLEEVPRDISRLVNLRVLMLDTNSLYDLPEELCLLPHLEKLSLSNNHLSRLPRNFPKLRSLQSLHAANNEFVNFPEAVCSLTKLYFVDFSDNNLIMLPATIRKLAELETLILYRNSLTQLPDALCDLGELRLLWLGKNHIKYLPRKFGQLRLLDWGVAHTLSTVLDGNPLTHPPLHVCKQGTAAIENYFRSTESRTAIRSQKSACLDRRMEDVPEEREEGEVPTAVSEY